MDIRLCSNDDSAFHAQIGGTAVAAGGPLGIAIWISIESCREGVWMIRREGSGRGDG